MIDLHLDSARCSYTLLDVEQSRDDLCNEFVTQNNFISRLHQELPKSSNAHREVWAQQIVSGVIDFSEIIGLINHGGKIGKRTLWLISQIAMEDAHFLRPHLADVYTTFERTNISGGETSIVNQWVICGVPENMESICINRCFEWLASRDTTSTTKSRCIKVLLQLREKYPEIYPEFKFTLESVSELHSGAFQRLVNKSIEQL